MSERFAESGAGRRDDSQPLAAFVASIPDRLAWVQETAASGECPGCGTVLAGSNCHASVMSMWCGTVGRHIVPKPSKTPASVAHPPPPSRPPGPPRHTHDDGTTCMWARRAGTDSWRAIDALGWDLGPCPDLSTMPGNSDGSAS